MMTATEAIEIYKGTKSEAQGLPFRGFLNMVKHKDNRWEITETFAFWQEKGDIAYDAKSSKEIVEPDTNNPAYWQEQGITSFIYAKDA